LRTGKATSTRLLLVAYRLKYVSRGRGRAVAAVAGCEGSFLADGPHRLWITVQNAGGAARY
jgi:hypothetical protein